MSIENSLKSLGEAPIELKVEYKRVNTFLSDFCKNISRNYTFIKTKNPLPTGTRFVFRIGVEGLAEPLELKGYVKGVVTEESTDKDRPPGMDIEFVYQDEADREALMTRVYDLIEAQMGPRLGERIREHIEASPS
jgi:type IV pilus assembly protein PilZ